jgi:translation elongation factor EF-G
MAFKTIAESTGDLTFVRVYSGVLSKGTALLNTRTGKTERIGRLARMSANKREAIDEIRAGDIGAIIGLKNTITGDTLCDEENPIALNKIQFPDAVISMSLEPKKSSDRDKLGEIIGKLVREDPTFRAQTIEATGELVISGMGELHLEIITHRIQNDFKCDVATGKPKVAYKQRLKRALETEARFIRQSGGPRPVRRRSGSVRARSRRPTATSSSSTASRAARARASTSRRSRRPARGLRERRRARLPVRERARDALRRQEPRRRLERARVPPAGVHGVPQARRTTSCCSSRS